MAKMCVNNWLITVRFHPVLQWHHPFWNRILLLRPFHKELIIWEKVSLDFCKRDKQQLRFTMCCHSTGLRINPWRKLTCKIYLFLNSRCYVTHIIIIKTSYVQKGETGGQCPVLANTGVTLLKEKSWQRTKPKMVTSIKTTDIACIQ